MKHHLTKSSWFTVILLSWGLMPFAFSVSTLANDTPSEEIPPVIRVDGERVYLGKITIIPTKQRLELPARINLSEELIEYVLVEEKGKVHESLLVTQVPAMDLQLALLMITPRNPGTQDSVKPGPGQAQASLADIEMHLEWHDTISGLQELPLEEFILQDPPKRPMQPTKWRFQTAKHREGKLEATVTGSLITIIRSDDAIIAYPGQDRENDEIWFANKATTPAVGTPINLIIRNKRP